LTLGARAGLRLGCEGASPSTLAVCPPSATASPSPPSSAPPARG
jgi:hypothetical protein